MTKAQRLGFYLPAWQRAARANWRTQRGCAVPVAGRAETDTLMEVERAAQHLTGKPTPSVDEHRYACHALTVRHLRAHKTGLVETATVLPAERISSDDLSNAEIEQSVWLFRLLADADDLEAVMNWINPDTDQRKRYLWALDHQFIGGYVARVCLDKFGTSDFNDLDLVQLGELVMTLRSRPGSKATGANHDRPF